MKDKLLIGLGVLAVVFLMFHWHHQSRLKEQSRRDQELQTVIEHRKRAAEAPAFLEQQRQRAELAGKFEAVGRRLEEETKRLEEAAKLWGGPGHETEIP